MRKIWILALCCLILCAVPALAEDDVVISAPDTLVPVDGETTLTFTIDDNSGFAGMVMDVHYDADAFDVKSAEAWDKCIAVVNTEYAEGVVRAVFANKTDMTDKETVLTLTLASKGIAGEYPVTCAFSQTVGADLESVSVSAEESTLTIFEPEIITITTEPTKTEYIEGDSFDKAGMVVTMVDADGTQRVLAENEYTVTPETLGVNDTFVTVSYAFGSGKTATAQTAVSVLKNDVMSINVTYEQGEDIVYASYPVSYIMDKVAVEAVYRNGTREDVTAQANLSETSLPEEGGKCELTVTYLTFSEKISVNVTKVVPDHIMPVFEQGENVVYDTDEIESLRQYLTVQLVNNDGSYTDVTEDAVLSAAKLLKGENTITVEYGTMTETFTVNVTKNTVERIEATYTQGEDIVYASADIDTILAKTKVEAVRRSGMREDVSEQASIKGTLPKDGGNCELTVAYDGFETTITVNVTKVMPDHIEANFVPGDTVIYDTDTCDTIKQYVSLRIVNNDGSYGDEMVQEEIGYSPSGTLSKGNNTITVTYGEITGTFNVFALHYAQIVSIRATFEQGSQVIYSSGSTRDILAQTAVEAVFDDESTQDVSEYAEISGTLSEEGGECALTVSYGTFTTTITVNVTKVEFDHIEATFTQGSAVIFDTDSLEALRSYLTLRYINNDGSEAQAPGEVELTGTLSEGESTVTATCGGKSDTFTVNVTKNVVQSIEAAYDQGTDIVYASGDINTILAKTTVTALWADGAKTDVSADAAIAGTLSEDGGTCSLTVSYGVFTSQINVNVTKVAPDHIEAAFAQGETVVYDVDALSSFRNMLTVTLTNNDGSTSVVTEECVLSGELTEGESTVTVTYGELNDTFTVNVTKNVVERIEATYVQGSDVLYPSTDIDTVLRKTKVEAVYLNGKREDVSKDAAITGTLSEAGGECALTVSCGTFTTTITVQVTKVAPDHIEATFAQGDAVVYDDASLDSLKSYLTVRVVNNDGSTEAVTEGFALSGTLRAPESVVTVTYETMTSDFSVCVEHKPVIVSIRANYTQGDKKVYASADILDILSETVVEAVYDDETTVDVSGSATISGTFPEAGGECALTITYLTFTTEITVNVTKVELDHINVAYVPQDGKKVFDTDSIASLLDDVTVLAVYNSGESKNVKDEAEFTGTLTEGECEVTVQYGGKSNSFPVTVWHNRIETMVVSYAQTAPVCTGSKLDAIQRDMTVAVTYTNGTENADFKDYTLSGTLCVGESTMTVSEAEGKEATFAVTVSDHDWGEGEITTQATKTSGAERTYICSICSAIRTESVALPTSITLSAKTLTMGVGMKTRLTVEPKAEDVGMQYTYSVSPAKNAEITEDGMITALKKGSATVTVKTVNGKSATCKITIVAAPTAVTLAPESVTMNVGDTTKVTTTVSPAKAYDKDLEYTFEPAGIVTLENGVLTAIGEGTATVTVTSANYKTVTDTMTVSVLPKPETVTVSSTMKVGVKETAQIEWSIPENTHTNVTFVSMDKKIATVDAKGVVKGVKGGETDILVKGGVTDATVHVEVVPAVTSVKLAQTKATLAVGETAQIAYTILPDNAKKAITFTSSNTKVATVDETGLVTAGSKTGTAKITAKAGNKSATFTVTVKALATEVSLSLSATELLEKSTAKATTKVVSPKNAVANVTLVSDNPSVVTVSGMTVTAESAGSATIKGVWKGGETNSVTVTVGKAAASVEFDEPETTLAVGQKKKYQVTFPTGETDTVTFSSSNAKVLSVAKDGTVTAKKAGKATLTATTKTNGAKAAIEITVENAPKSVKLSTESADKVTSATLAMGESVAFTCAVLPAGVSQDFTFECKSENVSVEKTASGFTVTALKDTGSATITVKSQKKNTVKTTLKITLKKAPVAPDSEVEKPVYTVTLKPSAKKLTAGKTITFKTSFTKGYGAYGVTWTSDNEDVLRFEKETVGKAKVVSTGSVTVTATFFNGVTASYSFGVSSKDAAESAEPVQEMAEEISEEPQEEEVAAE